MAETKQQGGKHPQGQDGGRSEQRANGQAQRSESLLPADDAADGRYEVAEEVSLDQQSDALRRVGKPPRDIACAVLPGADEETGKEGGGRQDLPG